jgi:hypothetical protein
VTRPRPLVIGLSAGALAVGADYLAHAVFAVPLSPEQAGYVLLKLMPLSTFENLLKALGVLARPLLLVGATLVIIAAYGVAASLIARLQPRIWVPLLGALVLVVGTIVAIVAWAPGDSVAGVVVEVILLAAMVPIVDLITGRLSSPALANEDRRILLRNLFYGAVGIAVLGIGYATVRRSPSPREIAPAARLLT